MSPILLAFVAFIFLALLAEYFTRHNEHPIVPEPWDIGAPSAPESYGLMTGGEEE